MIIRENRSRDNANRLYWDLRCSISGEITVIFTFASLLHWGQLLKRRLCSKSTECWSNRSPTVSSRWTRPKTPQPRPPPPKKKKKKKRVKSSRLKVKSNQRGVHFLLQDVATIKKGRNMTELLPLNVYLFTSAC